MISALSLESLVKQKSSCLSSALSGKSNLHHNVLYEQTGGTLSTNSAPLFFVSTNSICTLHILECIDINRWLDILMNTCFTLLKAKNGHLQMLDSLLQRQKVWSCIGIDRLCTQNSHNEYRSHLHLKRQNIKTQLHCIMLEITCSNLKHQIRLATDPCSHNLKSCNARIDNLAVDQMTKVNQLMLLCLKLILERTFIHLSTHCHRCCHNVDNTRDNSLIYRETQSSRCCITLHKYHGIKLRCRCICRSQLHQLHQNRSDSGCDGLNDTKHIQECSNFKVKWVGSFHP